MTRTLPDRPLLAPSILSADFTRLGEELETIREAGAGLVHIDVMDAHFVPNLTIGVPVVASLRGASDLPFDVHLMIENPSRWVDDYISAGADMVSVHAEADPHLHRTVQRIREQGARAGVALNPATPISAVEDLLPELDHVLVMSVNPGFSGQKFIPQALEKLTRLRQSIVERGLDVRLEIDGGVNADNATELVRAGADMLVAGSAVFGAPDPAAAARGLLDAMAAGIPALTGEPSVSEVRVRYFETDRMGGAYHTHYLVWFEVARTDYIRASGGTYREFEEEGFILPVLEAYCRYRRTARYDERIRVEARCERYKRARIRFLYRAVGEDDAVVAEGWTTHAVTDRDGVPQQLPASLLDRLFPSG